MYAITLEMHENTCFTIIYTYNIQQVHYATIIILALAVSMNLSTTPFHWLLNMPLVVADYYAVNFICCSSYALEVLQHFQF